MKTLSLIFNAPIIRRGTSNLDHIAYNVKREGYQGFLVVYTRHGNPSVLTLYKLINEYFELIGRIFIIGVYINRRARGNFDGLIFINKGESEGANHLFQLLKKFFNNTREITISITRPVKAIIGDLEVLRDSHLKKFLTDEKFKPSKIEFFDNERGEMILRIKVHHVWMLE